MNLKTNGRVDIFSLLATVVHVPYAGSSTREKYERRKDVVEIAPTLTGSRKSCAANEQLLLACGAIHHRRYRAASAWMRV